MKVKVIISIMQNCCNILESKQTYKIMNRLQLSFNKKNKHRRWYRNLRGSTQTLLHSAFYTYINPTAQNYFFIKKMRSV